MAKHTSTQRSGCPLSTALELIGDPWSLLIVRDLMFRRLRTFNEFLNAGEGIASNILAARLRRLEGHGIITKQADVQDARRNVYRLTRKGLDLAPPLMELVIWAAKYERTDAPDALVREMRLQRKRVLARLRAAWTSASA